MRNRIFALATIAALVVCVGAGSALARPETPAKNATQQVKAAPQKATQKTAQKAKIVREKKPVPVKYAGTFSAGKLDEAMRRAAVPPEFANEVRGVLGYLPGFPQFTRKSSGSFHLIGARDGKKKELLAASIRTGGKEYRLYRYGSSDGENWVDAEGNLLSPAAFVKPVDGGQMTSPFGWRVHPILGDVRFHNGVDFALPRGSPVFAAQSGVVTEVGCRGNYGNLVRIQHGRNMETVYAHLDGFAPGMKIGSRVRRGQTIAYVGATGLATGPHLYWETVRDDLYLDPLRLLEEAKVPARKVEELRRNVAELEKSAPPPASRGRGRS